MAELLEKDLVYRIIGCAMTVHNTLGNGSFWMKRVDAYKTANLRECTLIFYSR